MCASPQASCGWDRQAAVGQWASYRAKGCVDGHCVQLGALAWGWPPAGSLCRFGRDLELLRGGLLRLVRSCSCLLGSRSQIGGRPHWLGCTQCFAGVYAEGPAPSAASASHRERSRSAGVPCFELISSSSSSVLPLGKRRSVCSLSEVCRMELSCAPKARIHVLQAPALMITSLMPQGSERLCLALRQRSSVRVRNSGAASLVSSHLEECHIYI